MNTDLGTIIHSLLYQNEKNDQMIVGIAGGSGSGKTTVAKAIENRLNKLKVEYVCLDRFFLPIDEMPTYYSRYLDKAQPNFNRPDSIDSSSMIDYCRKIAGFNVVILDGHFALYWKEMRDLMHLKCFITAEVEEMLERRTIRNLKANYGGDRDNILNYNRECVLPMYNSHIYPTMKYADILIPNSGSDNRERDSIIDVLCRELQCTKRIK